MDIKRTILIIDTYNFEIEKTKMIFRNLANFDFIELKNKKQYDVMSDKLKNISLIVLDIEFPTPNDGFNVLKLIRQNKHLEKTPIIIITRAENVSYRDSAQLFSVMDYIMKPYEPIRLEKSVRAIFNTSKPIEYHFNKATVVTVSMEDYIKKEIKISGRSKNNLSIVLITPNLSKLESNNKSMALELMQEQIYDITMESIKKSARSTDTIIFNDKRDIILVLPCTNAEGAYLFNEKITTAISGGLSSFDLTFDDIFCSVNVAYPDEGDNLETLMSIALKKVSDKTRLDKINSINKATINTVSSSYKKFIIKKT